MPPAIALLLAQLVLCGCVSPAVSADAVVPRRVLHQPLFPIEWTPPPSSPPPPAPDFTSDPSPPVATPDAPPGDFFPPAPPVSSDGGGGGGGTASSPPNTVTADVSTPPSAAATGHSPKKATMRYGEVVHFSHPQHRLRLEHLETPFRCDGCKEAGIGARYRCPVQGCAAADHDLHRQCALPLSPPPPPLRHPFYPKCAFHFMARAPGAPGTRYCNACGRDVAGFVYHCRACGFDLHPCCATLPHALDASDRGGRVGVRLYLHPKAEAACHRCGHRGRSWTYRSHCKSYSLHVACVMDMVVESWNGVGRNKGASTGGRGVYDGALVAGSGGYRVPVIRGAAKSSHASRGGSYWGMRKGKVKRCCEIAGFAAQVVISAVLGDPTALIAGVVGSLMAR